MQTHSLEQSVAHMRSTSPIKPAYPPKEWLEIMIVKATNSKHGIWGGAVELTPERAEYLLRANDANRAVSSTKVREIAADIEAGRWALNGEPIIISTAGDLNDGQHRCHGAIKAGKSILTAIIVGAARKTRTTIDTGKARTTGDLMSMEGVLNHNALASAGAVLLVLEQGNLATINHRTQLHKSVPPTKVQKHEFAIANLSDLEWAFGSLSAAASAMIGSRSRLAGILAYIARKTNDFEKASEFINAITNGDNLASDSPAFAARQRLLALARIGQTAPYKTVEVIFRAWNAQQRGDQLQRINITGQIPELIV